MKLLTLTSDFGLHDHYVASLKASIIRRDASVQMIDISHNIIPFDTAQAAYVLNSCFSEFVEGTVHIIAVDSEPIVHFGGHDGSFPCILELNGQFVISTDNGFFGAFLGERMPDQFWRIDDILSNPKLFKFPSKNMLVPAAIDILNGKELATFCSPQETYKKAYMSLPKVEENLIVGHIAYIDSYGNSITNIDQELFERVGKNHPYTIFFRKKDYYLDVISNSYNEVPPGERVCIFNENRFLEIAINRGANLGGGGAEKLFGLKKGDQVRIEFMPRGSKETLHELF
ncbi:MAG: SAM-dependent chlorinase/fluorinase [Crocinitomicaceae bacterium]